MKLGKVRKITLIGMAASLLCLLIAKIVDMKYFEISIAFGIIAIVIAAACLIFNFKHNRCPHCKTYFYRIAPEYCPHCGEKIDE